MRRLKSKLLSMENDTTTFTEMYNGRMRVFPPRGERYTDYDPTYYYEGGRGPIAFYISETHKMTADVPTVTVQIPMEMLLLKERGDQVLRRLKYYLSKMENSEAAYDEMYEGRIYIPPDASAPPGYRGAPGDFGEVEYDPKYWHDDISFNIAVTDKEAKDKPTVTVAVPAEKLLKKDGSDVEMKRLKYYLMQMDNDTSTYKEMYDGKTVMAWGSREPEIVHDNTYWHGDISFDITGSHKLAKDKPTLTWHIPAEKIGIETYTKAAADYCLRAFAPYIDRLNEALYNRSRPDNETGKYYLYRPGGEVVIRNTAYFALCPQKDYENGGGDSIYILDDGIVRPPRMCLCIRLQVQLPKRKLRRTIQMLCRDLPEAVDEFVTFFDPTELAKAVALAEKQAAIREWLCGSEYCAFVANGSILPRSKGTDLPMAGAIPFRSTPDDEIEICGVRGMGIRRGVTVITGGGYSGKSTLLDAISAGIYDHVAGDGRELCVTDPSAVTISAEDGRAVNHVNISPFIKWLPGGSTADFSTDRASGSTSQAANIMEAVDAGAKLLLIDEDRSATNFMIRDRVMKELIEREPITPFTDRVAELCRDRGTSTILVIGGSGEYLSVADKVYLMDEYVIHDVTERARGICEAHGVMTETPAPADWEQGRQFYSDGFTSYPDGSGSERLLVSDLGFIVIGDERIDVRGLHDIISPRQLDALGFMLRYLEVSNSGAKIDIESRIDELYDKIESEGLDFVWSGYFTTCERFLDLPRKCELMAVISRMRHLHIERVISKRWLILRNLPELTVQDLNDVRRVYDFTNLQRIFKKRAQNFPVFLPAFNAGRILSAPALTESYQIFLRFVQRHRLVDFLQVGHYLLDILIADIAGRRPNLMHDAALQTAVGKDRLNRLHHSAQPICAEQINVHNSPAFEFVQHI